MCCSRSFVKDMVLLHTLQHRSRIQDVTFCQTVEGDRELMLVAAEDKKVTVYETFKDEEKVPSIIAELVGATSR